MSFPWATLNTKTEGFRTLLPIADADSKIREVVFCGLQVKLSEILAKYSDDVVGTNLTIYADTLVVDVASFNARAVVAMARCVDVSALKDAAIVVTPALDATTPSALQLLVGSVVGGQLKVAAAAGSAGTEVYSGISPLKVVYCTRTGDAVSLDTRGQTADLQDILSHTWGLNTLKSSYAAAAWLIDADNAEDRAVAQPMLQWVVNCIATLGADGATLSGEFQELYTNASSLLVVLSVGAGTYYVPVLASDFYTKQIDSLLNALSRYETNYSALDITSNIHEAVARVSKTLEGVAQDQVDALKLQLTDIKRNVTTLSHDTQVLRRQVQLQQIDTDARLAVMQAAITSARINRVVEVTFTLVGNGVKAGLAVGGKSKKPGEGLSALVDIGKNARDIAVTADASEPDRKLIYRSKALVLTQERVMVAWVAGTTLWEQAQNNPSGATTFTHQVSFESADLGLAWDNFMVSAESEVTTIKESFDSSATDAQASANRYLASLKILAQYGKAINAKFAAAAAQMAQGTLVSNNIHALESTQQRWLALQAKAKTDQEKLAALKGVIQTRMDNIKRSIFTAWVHYRNSYFYLNFVDPPRTIRLDMNAAELTTAFVAVRSWVARLKGDTPDGAKVRLPDDNVQVSLTFPIVLRAAGASTSSALPPNAAVLTPAAGDKGAELTWTVPVANQLAGILPDGGNVAIWIKDAKFFFDKVQPNDKGNVIVQVSTSGSYQNGYGPAESYSFVSKGLIGHYAYSVADENVYNSWTIDAEVYATPTPFTQWTMLFDRTGGDPSAAKSLRLDLTVAYRSKS